MHPDASALDLVMTGDPALLAIVRLSLLVSLTAVLFAAADRRAARRVHRADALSRPRRRRSSLLNALMGLPPVVVGLAVYLLLSRSGPLGALGLLFTPQAMVVAQTILVTPIIAALARQTIEDLWVGYRDELDGDECRPARPRRDADLGRAASALSSRCSRASAAPRPRSAPSSSSAAISTASPAP